MRLRRECRRDTARDLVAAPEDRYFAIASVVDAVSWSERFELFLDRAEFQGMTNDPTTREYVVLWSRSFGPTSAGIDLLEKSK